MLTEPVVCNVADNDLDPQAPTPDGNGRANLHYSHYDYPNSTGATGTSRSIPYAR